MVPSPSPPQPPPHRNNRKRTAAECDFEESMAGENQSFENFKKERLADQQKIKELETEVGQLKTEVGQLKTKVGRLEISRENDQEKFKDLEKEFGKLKEELEKMKKKKCDGCGAEHVNDTTFWSPKCRKNQ